MQIICDLLTGALLIVVWLVLQQVIAEILAKRVEALFQDTMDHGEAPPLQARSWEDKRR